MDSLHIYTSEKRVAINDDPARVIVFNPSDITFAEKFYKLIEHFQAKQAEYQERARELDRMPADDPLKIGAGLAFLREVCEHMRGEIDNLFGAGASDKAFGGALDLDLFEQFFAGIVPFVQAARQEKMLRYLNQREAGKVMQ
jgi:hypothetical protein